MKDRASKNIELYPWYVYCVNAYAWMPVFFLFISSRVSLQQVLWLEAIYYAVVVGLEVPSGYLSDRLGRCLTLRLASASLVVSYGVFTLSTGFASLLVAQSLLAAGIALNSGTDTSFHLDSLTMCERASEYGAREARISRGAFWSNAVAALLGGVLGLFSLRIAYGLSFLAALGALGLSARFSEPSAHDAPSTRGFFSQLRVALRHGQRAPLRWYFAFAVLAMVLNHIPYEFYQSFLDLTAREWGGASLSSMTPAIAGVHMSIALAIAGVIGGVSITLSRVLGVRRLLLLSALGEVGLVALMAGWLHPIVALCLIFRSAPRALQGAPLNEAVAPRVPRSLRATYLSLQSLVGRLGYSALLFLLSAIVGSSGQMDASTLSSMLWWSSALALAGLFVLGLWAAWGDEGEAEASGGANF